MRRIQNWQQALVLMVLGSVFTIIGMTFSPVKVRANPPEQTDTVTSKTRLGKSIEEWLTTPEGKEAYDEIAEDFPFLTMTPDEWIEKDPRGQKFWAEVSSQKITVHQAMRIIEWISKYGYTEAKKRTGHFLGRVRRMLADLMEAGPEISYRLQSGLVADAYAVDQRVEPPRYFDGLSEIVHGTEDLTDILRLLFIPCIITFILTKRNWLKCVTMGIWLLTFVMDSPNLIFHIIVTALVALLVYFARWIVRLVKRRTKQQNDST